MTHVYKLKRDKPDARDYKLSLAPIVKLPESIDLRLTCPPIFNQYDLGSCTANAGVACKEMLIKNVKNLSRLFLYYQERFLENTVNSDSGASIRDICKATQKFGICEEEYMPYNVSKFSVAPSTEAINNAKQYTISKYHSVNTLEDIKQLISRQKTVLIGMNVYESMQNIPNSGVLPLPKASEKLLGGHAVLVVGYNNEGSVQSNNTNIFSKFLNYILNLFGKSQQQQKGYLIVRNSWGTSWGDKGYFYMPYEYFAKYAFDFWTMEG